MKPLYKIHEKIIKIVFGNSQNEIPLNLKQKYELEVLLHNYETLQTIFKNSTSVTRKKLIELPKPLLEAGKKKNYYCAIEVFNSLPNQLKILSEKERKKKLKEYLSKR